MKVKLIILLALDSLDEIFYYASMSREKKMYKSINSVKQDLDNGISIEPKQEEKQRRLF